jgi:hypothetical protein
MGTLPPRYNPPGGYRGGRGARAAALYYARKRRRDSQPEPEIPLPPGVDQIIDNSRWLDASGSKVGADLVLPAGWTVGFNTLDDVQIIPAPDNHNGGRYVGATGQRGIVQYNLDVTGRDGEFLNFSAYVDEVVASQGAQRMIHVSGNMTIVKDVIRPEPGFKGRIAIVAQVAAGGTFVNFRMGAGTTAVAPQDFDFSLSRPQATWGEELYVYQPRPA